MGFVIPEIPPADRGVVGLDPTGCASPGRQGDELGEDQVSRDGTWRGKRFVFKSAPTNGCSVGLQSAGLDISSRDRLQRQSRRRRGSALSLYPQQWGAPAVGACVGGAAVAVVSGFGAAAAGVTGWTVGAAVALGAGRGLGCRRRRRGGDLRCEDGRLLRGSGGLAGQEHQRQKQQKRESDDFDVTYAGKRRFTFYGM